ncbi:MAG: hypothetical protein K8F91_20615 [Candidatus Obscuribacterales bacterium]|nr:hypothetical protein [Candidatus Obscuribacterales bacterium]
MANKGNHDSGMNFPINAMLVMAVLGALVSGFSFEIIKYWPLPVSVEPYFGFEIGWIWGATVGAVTGLVLGYLTDERHFLSAEEKASRESR